MHNLTLTQTLKSSLQTPFRNLTDKWMTAYYFKSAHKGFQITPMLNHGMRLQAIGLVMIVGSDLSLINYTLSPGARKLRGACSVT